MTKTTRPFIPDWVSPPGDTIANVLEERDWTQAQLAERLGCTTKHITLLINGKVPINEETALKLQGVLGGTAAFWLRREAQYRAAIARKEKRIGKSAQEERREVMQIVTSWMRQGIEQGVEQGLEREKNLVLRQLKRKLGEEIEPKLQTKVKRLAVEQLEALGEALFDFSSVEDLQIWLDNLPLKASS
jgi:addiction module HigA family antidote